MAKTALDTSRQWELIYTSHGNQFLTNEDTDQFYDDRPALAYLRANALPAQGGERLVIPVNHGGGSGGIGTYTRGAQFGLVDRDPITAAKYPWAYYKGTVVIDAIEEHEAGGPGARLNLVSIKIKDTIEALMDKISEDLLATTQATDGVIPLDDLIPTDPTTGTVGTINRATASNSWWRSQADNTGTVMASAGTDAIRTLYNDCTVKGRQPEVLLMGQTIHEKFEDLIEGSFSFQAAPGHGDSRKGGLGFGGGIGYKNARAMWDEDMAANLSTDMFFLNNKGVMLVEHKGMAFKLHPFENLLPSGLHARGAIVTWWGNAVAKEPRLCGRLGTIS